MIPHPARQPRRSAALGVLLAISLLLTQWLGYAHAIAHAGVPAEFAAAQAAKGDPFDHAKSASACAALDAIALGAGLQSTGLPPLPPAMADAPVPQPLRNGWHRLFTAHFSSRAPPLNA